MNLEDPVEFIGYEFPGSEDSYLELDAGILFADAGADGCVLYIDGFINDIPDDGQTYLVNADDDLQFIDVYCDGTDDDELKVVWFAETGDVAAVVDTGLTCPTGRVGI